MDSIFNDNDVRIITCDCAEGLPANLYVMRIASSCARGLPDGAMTWDLRALVVDGANVRSKEVARWLAAVRSMFGMDPDALARDAPLDLNEFKAVLLFADAIGGLAVVRKELFSTPRYRLGVALPSPAGRDLRQGADKDAVQPPPKVAKVAKVAEKSAFTLRIEDGVFYMAMSQSIVEMDTKAGAAREVPCAGAFDILAAAFEEWLYLACRLDLPVLARLLLDNVRVFGMSKRKGIACSDASKLFTPRVVHAVPRRILVQAWLKQAFVVEKIDIESCKPENDKGNAKDCVVRVHPASGAAACALAPDASSHWPKIGAGGAAVTLTDFATHTSFAICPRGLANALSDVLGA